MGESTARRAARQRYEFAKREYHRLGAALFRSGRPARASALGSYEQVRAKYHRAGDELLTRTR